LLEIERAEPLAPPFALLIDSLLLLFQIVWDEMAGFCWVLAPKYRWHDDLHQFRRLARFIVQPRELRVSLHIDMSSLNEVHNRHYKDKKDVRDRMSCSANNDRIGQPARKVGIDEWRNPHQPEEHRQKFQMDRENLR
jgi:hypothetical protein